MWEIVTAPLILLLKGILIQFFVSKMNGRECVFSVSEMFCYKNREHDFFVSQKAQVLFFFFFLPATSWKTKMLFIGVYKRIVKKEREKTPLKVT